MRLLAIVILGFVASAACKDDRRVQVPAGSRDTTPMVGGACEYQRVAFRGVVESVAPDGSVLVSAVDTLPDLISRCHLLASEGGGRWRLRGSALTERPQVGDSLRVEGEVIVMGTCTPCAVSAGVESGAPR